MNNPNIDNVWKERKELKDFRNIDRLANYQLCHANGHAMPLFITVKK